MQKAALLCCSAHVNMSGMFRVSFTQLVSGSQTSHAASQGSFISARPSLCLTNCESSLPLFLFLTSFFPLALFPLTWFFFSFLPGLYQVWCSGSDLKDPGRAALTSSQLILWSLENSSAPSSPSIITWMTKTTMQPENPQRASRSAVTTTDTSGCVCALTLFSLAFISGGGAKRLLSLYLGL